jgi:uncharacterized protein YeeX (DUF496 family)
MTDVMVMAAGFWDSSSVLGWSAFIGLIITAATVVGASARNSHNAQTLANYRDVARSWKEKSEAQDVAIKELEARDEERERKLADLQGQVTMLRELLTARPAFEQLAGALADLTRQMDTRVTDALAQTSQIRQEIREVHDDVLRIGRPS